jgi:hypothetical protein
MGHEHKCTVHEHVVYDTLGRVWRDGLNHLLQVPPVVGPHIQEEEAVLIQYCMHCKYIGIWTPFQIHVLIPRR